jgi:outer membrane protein OmpA-like peptidoglycan-associated protein
MRIPRVVSPLIALLLVTALPPSAHSQLGNLKKKAEEAARTKAEEALKKAAADSAKKAAADSAAKADSSRAKGNAATGAAKPDPKVWDNYDFVPGSKVLFFTDFSEDRVGNFARGLRFRSGQMDVVERDGVKMLRSTARSEFLIPVGRKLPERFTLELDVIAPSTSLHGYDLVAFEGGSRLDRGAASAEINWQTSGTLIIGGGVGMNEIKFPDAMQPLLNGQVAHIRVLMDSGYFKLYTNERRIYNIPVLPFKRDSVIRVFVKGTEQPNQATFVTSIRVAESETDVLYDALAAKGRWATQGILFATGKADLQPESRPVLKEIASTLKAHPELKVLIEGHTDNVGTPASNLALSDARAAAVKNALVTEFGVDEGRVATKGLGDTTPAAPNTTATGRAQNRRVEIVKQ